MFPHKPTILPKNPKFDDLNTDLSTTLPKKPASILSETGLEELKKDFLIPTTQTRFEICPLIKTYGYCYLTDKQYDSAKKQLNSKSDIDHINKYHSNKFVNIANVCPTVLLSGLCPLRDQEHITKYGVTGHT